MEWIYLKSLYEIRNDSNLSISKLTLDLNNLYNANIRNSKIWEWKMDEVKFLKVTLRCYQIILMFQSKRSSNI